MSQSSGLEGTIRAEGSLLVGEGDKGLQMYDDTMQLAIAKTARTGYVARTVLSTVATVVAAWAAYRFDSLPTAALGGAMAVVSIQQGRNALAACRQYASSLDEAVSHGWGSREQLKRIDSIYL